MLSWRRCPCDNDKSIFLPPGTISFRGSILFVSGISSCERGVGNEDENDWARDDHGWRSGCGCGCVFICYSGGGVIGRGIGSKRSVAGAKRRVLRISHRSGIRHAGRGAFLLSGQKEEASGQCISRRGLLWNAILHGKFLLWRSTSRSGLDRGGRDGSRIDGRFSWGKEKGEWEI